MRPLSLLLLLALPLAAATFVPPEERKSLFRRDLLPIDTDTMRALSGHLTDLARRETRDEPLQLRATAQLLAVAIRLDPANRPARELALRLAAGKPVPPTQNNLDRALSQTWRVVDWLLQAESGPEGQLLGHQLLDALHVIAPRDSKARLHDAPGEAARWEGIVADLTRFAADRPAREDPPAPERNPEPRPAPPPLPLKRPPIQLRQAQLRTPLFLEDGDLKLSRRMAELSMEVIDQEDPALLNFTLDPAFQSPLLEVARERVRRSLEHTWPVLPDKRVAILKARDGHYAALNGTAIAGPASLLLHAALAGKELRSDVVFLGDLHSDGSLKRPMWSWDYLRALWAAKTGGRLLVPSGMQAELRAMLAFEEPAFFVKWEVLMVSSLEAALSLASEDGDPEGLAATSQLFAEIRGLAAQGKDVGQLCVHEKVRDQLATILSRAPFHFSSAMLLVQGSAQRRPTRVDREMAARILRSAVEPLSPLAHTPLQGLSAARLAVATEATRAEINRFTRFFADKDLDLHKEAQAVVGLAEILRRGRVEARRDAQGVLTYRGLPLTHHQGQLQGSFSTFLINLAPFTGENVAEPVDNAEKAQNPAPDSLPGGQASPN